MKTRKSEFELQKVLVESRGLEADSKVPHDMLHGLYVMRLMEEGVSAEKAFDLVIDGILRPN